MNDSRDEFPAKIKKALAERAGQRCSFCKTPTVGPSDESPTAVMSIGVAAHITAAAPGRGARRYDISLTSEERSSVDNGIWLCQSCSVIIDRDEVRFPAEALRAIKREHTEFARLGECGFGDVDIIAIGPHLTAVGQVVSAGPDGMQVRLAFFLEGSAQDLLSFIHEFDCKPTLERHVIVAEMGTGGLLAEPPTIEREGNAYVMRFRWQLPAPRLDVSKPLTGISAETGRPLSGIDYLIQTFERVLSLARGTWFTNVSGGSYVSELYWRFKESSWFTQLIKTELVRLASIPSPKSLGGSDKGYAPLLCVNRVYSAQVPNFDLDDRQRLRIQVDFDLEGLGHWAGDLLVYIYNPEDLEIDRAKASWMNENIRRIESGERPLPTMLPPEGWRLADGFPPSDNS